MKMTDLERLVAIEEIKLLKARRIRAMDEKRWADYEALHAPDHVSDTYADAAAIGAKATTDKLAEALTGITSVHHAHTPEIVITSPTSATGVWPMEDMLFWKQGDEDHWLHGYGHYHERYRKDAEGWRFVYRRLTRIRVDLSPGARSGSLSTASSNTADATKDETARA